MYPKIINGRIHIFPDDGKRVTNGIDVYAKEIILGVGLTSDGYYEITDEEYNEILEAEVAEFIEE